MFERECPGLVRTSKDLRVLLDTNAFRYRLNGNGLKFAVSSGVFKELGRYPDVFPDEVVRDLGILLNPDVINEMISVEDELCIERAVAKSLKSAYRRNKKIGWVDVQQIGYAMERAKRGENTVLVSNDGDILGTTSVLRRREKYIREHVAAVSVQRYLERKHEAYLIGKAGHSRRELIREIEGQYLAA